MYDEPYQEVVPILEHTEHKKDDLFHFIQVLVFESREWDNEYYNPCGRTVTSCLCPCSKIMRHKKDVIVFPQEL